MFFIFALSGNPKKITTVYKWMADISYSLCWSCYFSHDSTL